MLKYICNKYKERNSINEYGILVIKRKYLKEIKIMNVKNEVFSKASAPSLKYLTISSTFTEINNELQIIKLKVEINKLNEEIYIDKYLNSYLNIPEELFCLKKISSIILNKLIKKNHEKLNFIQPDKKIVNLTLAFISKIRKKLLKTNNYKIETTIRKKLTNLEKTLLGYIKDINTNKTENVLNPPLIIFNKDEKKLISFILKNDTYEAPKKFRLSIVKTMI